MDVATGNLQGTLHLYVAFDWGDEIDLEVVRQLGSAELHALSRRRRTPSSIAYRPAPLRLPLEPVRLELPHLGTVQAPAEATVFDFAAVSLGLHLPFSLSAAELLDIAAHLAQPEPLVAAGRAALGSWHARLLPAITAPDWSEFTEEYFVFELPLLDDPAPAEWLSRHAAWLAGLVRLESEPLSVTEIDEALRERLCYTPRDLFIAEWSAAALFDSDCGETLETIEFANLQLLEFRHIDDRLDRRLAAAYRIIHPLTRGWLPFWHTQARTLRALGDLRIEANELFERADNVLKLVGDQYLARIYRMLSRRFHLTDWQQSIQRSLDTVEGAHRVIAEQASANRIELLEAIVILLILIEVINTLWRH
jgi:hypothetical protein